MQRRCYRGLIIATNCIGDLDMPVVTTPAPPNVFRTSQLAIRYQASKKGDPLLNMG